MGPVSNCLGGGGLQWDGHYAGRGGHKVERAVCNLGGGGGMMV